MSIFGELGGVDLDPRYHYDSIIGYVRLPRTIFFAIKFIKNRGLSWPRTAYMWADGKSSMSLIAH